MLHINPLFMTDGDANYSCPTGRGRTKLSEGRRNMWLRSRISPIRYSRFVIRMWRISWARWSRSTSNLFFQLARSMLSDTKRLALISYELWRLLWCVPLIVVVVRCHVTIRNALCGRVGVFVQFRCDMEREDPFQWVTSDGRGFNIHSLSFTALRCDWELSHHQVINQATSNNCKLCIFKFWMVLDKTSNLKTTSPEPGDHDFVCFFMAISLFYAILMMNGRDRWLIDKANNWFLQH